MVMAAGTRKLVLSAHLTVSVGWIGAALAYLALGIAAAASGDAETVRSAWVAMDITGWFVIVPLALSSLATGLLIALGTKWGLLRHHWVIVSLALTVFATAILLLHMPSVSATADEMRQAQTPSREALAGDVLHPAVGVLILLAVLVLNIYKPAGLTPYGWRRQNDDRKQAVRARRGSALDGRDTAKREPAREQRQPQEPGAP